MRIDETKIEARIRELYKAADNFRTQAKTCEAIADELADVLCEARNNHGTTLPLSDKVRPATAER